MTARYFLVLAAISAAGCSKEVPAESTDPASDKPATQAVDETASVKGEKEVDSHDRFAKLAVDEVDRLLNEKKAVAVDANNDETRQELGTLPGALLLSNARQFEMSELPKDKGTELIFYCGSEKCMSAPKAAARAQEAGYSQVKVMPAGIRGWVSSGKPVEKS